ncbi:MAG: cytochrome P450 [Kribbellaceae bacterium]|nr:cytochrome P450 [Kribbellaceae bacterium]
MSAAHARLSFSGLGHGERTRLFDEIQHLDIETLGPAEPARFGDSRGWLISDMSIGRWLLTSSVGVKSRPKDSQLRLGGVGARQGESVRSLKRELVLAMGSVASDRSLMERHLFAALESMAGPVDGAHLTEALTSSTLTLLAAAEPGSVPGKQLRELVFGTWADVEAGGPGSVVDALYRFILDLLRTSRSPFMTSLRNRDWTAEEVAEELRAMFLAGWGSTAAAVLSSISLGVAERLAEEFVFDEVIRLYPPSFMIGRTIAEVTAGQPFRLGDVVLISPWLIHRNPRGWSEPARFDVGRWRERGVGSPWFLPFGLGPRRCPAATFARAQAATAGRLLRNEPRPQTTTTTLVEGRSPALTAG